MSTAMMRGPWTLEEGKSNYRFQVVDASGHVVARIVGGLLDGGREKAKLIEQAPALATALKCLIDSFEDDADVPSDVACDTASDVLRAAGWIP